MLVAALAAAALASGCSERDPAAERAALVSRGAEVFQARCSSCHGPKGDWPIAARLKGRRAAEFYALLDHLPSVNPVMPPFDASDRDRLAVAEYLASLRRGERRRVPGPPETRANPASSPEAKR
jgi:mono/diheme cytochrome c family protein